MNKYVKFMGQIQGLNEKIKVIDEAKAFVLPSRVEGMPQALIEAMAREKIVVASNSQAIRDIIKDNHNGYLFEFDNPEDLARVIQKATSKFHQKIRLAARKKVELFSWDRVIKSLEKVLNEVYSSK